MPVREARPVTPGNARRGYAAALAAVFIWALVPVGTRFFVLRVDPYVFNGVRFGASGLAALPFFLKARPWRWPRADRWRLFASAMLAVPGYNLPVALAARTVPAGAIGLVIATEPVMIVALTLVLYRKPIHRRLIAGSLLALIGVALTSGIMHSNRVIPWVSMLQVLFGAFCWSFYTVLAAPLNRRHGSSGVTGAIVVVGTLVLLTLSAGLMGTPPLPAGTTIFWLAAMGIASSLLGFFFWNYAGSKVPSERMGLFLYLIPLVSVSAGTQFLNEALTAQIVLGGTLIVIGVWIASRIGRAAGAPTPPAVRPATPP